MHDLGINKKTISLLYKELIKKKIVKSMGIPRQFADYPQPYLCGVHLKGGKRFTDGMAFKVNGWGYSYTSKNAAVLKSLAESIERFCQFAFRNTQFLFSSFNDLKQPALDPYLYITDKNIRNKKMSWIKGKNITINQDRLIPAQLVYLSYPRKRDEVLLQDINSTGTAAGFDTESTILRAIYETVERDSFMNTYLGKFPAKRINPYLIKDSNLKKLLKYLERYLLEINLFDITNDLKIPSYLSITVDHTGLGPSFGMGTKTSFNKLEAIKGAIEESPQSLPWIRREKLKFKAKPINIAPEEIMDRGARGLYWSDMNKLQHLDFLLNQSSKLTEIRSTVLSDHNALQNSIKNLKNSGFEVYIADITLNNTFDFNYYVYKAIIPGLQYLPLNETLRKINLKRLKHVGKFYHKSVNIPNSSPQPFL